MNEYKIEIREVLKRVITVAAKDKKQALKLIEKTITKSKVLNDSNQHLEKIKVKNIKKTKEKDLKNKTKIVKEVNETIKEINNITNRMQTKRRRTLYNI